MKKGRLGRYHVPAPIFEDAVAISSNTPAPFTLAYSLATAKASEVSEERFRSQKVSECCVVDFLTLIHNSSLSFVFITTHCGSS